MSWSNPLDWACRWKFNSLSVKKKKSVELWTHCNEYYIAELCVFAPGFCCFLNMCYSEQFLSRKDFALGVGAPWCTEGTLTWLFFILVFNNHLFSPVSQP